MKCIDAEGHVMEQDQELQQFLEKPYCDSTTLTAFPFFPTLDGWHREARRVADGRGRDIVIPTAEDWLALLHTLGIEQAILYPSQGLGFGFIKDAVWATVLARGYNNWLAANFVQKAPHQLRGVALLPVQDMQAAVIELKRAVEELGFVGGFIPAVGLRQPLGSAYYYPLYEAAEKLSCSIGVHGASGQGLGFDFFEQFVESRSLAHPFSQMIQFTSVLFERVLERFPGLHIAFLEGGSGWLPFLLERMEREYTHKKTKLSYSPLEQIKHSNVYFHTELDESMLPNVIALLGEDRLMGATDFPHEPATECRETLENFNRRNDLASSAKEKILYTNAQRFYRLK